jgi:hypothetical protein
VEAGLPPGLPARGGGAVLVGVDRLDGALDALVDGAATGGGAALAGTIAVATRELALGTAAAVASAGGELRVRAHTAAPVTSEAATAARIARRVPTPRAGGGASG